MTPDQPRTAVAEPGHGPCRPGVGLSTPRLRAGVGLVALLAAACSADERPSREDVEVPPTPSERRSVLLQPNHPAWSEPAPDTVRAVFETTRGDFTIEIVRAWAPIGADRFYNLVRHGYYDDARLHRVVSGFITQWGVAGDPEVTAVWYDRGMPDDPVLASNERGTIAFAFTEPGTRSTQVYINMVDNVRLDAQGFAPFGRVIEGMEAVVDSIYSGYGEESGGGVRAGAQARLVEEGNVYLDVAFPELDRILRARIAP